VTWGLIVVNIVIFFAEVGASTGPETIERTYGLVPGALISVPGALLPVLTLFSYQFLHADFMHLLGNMIFLWVFGDDIEECLGRLRFLGFYLAGRRHRGWSTSERRAFGGTTSGASNDRGVTITI
jgi:membrane associated rhomboid family serine protease